MNRTIDLGHILDLTTQLYDAAIEPSRWSDFLAALIRVFNADGVTLSQTPPDSTTPDFHLAVGVSHAGTEPLALAVDVYGCTRIEMSRADDGNDFTEDERRAFSLLAPHLERAINFGRQLSRDKGLPSFTLSSRQQQILRLGAQGLRSKEIAARLNLSVRTVEHHFTAAARQLKARGRSQAIATALEFGLIAP